MILLYKGKSWISRAIQFRCWDEYSHASWEDPANGHNFEAWEGGVSERETRNHGHTAGTPVDCFDLERPLTPGETDGLREFLASQVGKPYDYLGILHFVTRRPEAARDQAKWFCSELVFRGFELIKRPLLLRIAAYKVFPGMLAYSPLLAHVRSIETVSV